MHFHSIHWYRKHHFVAYKKKKIERGSSKEPLKVSQLIMLSLAALITGEAQRFVLMGKAFEHPQVQELLIANMDLDEVVYSSNHLSFKLHSSEDLKFLPFFFFHLKLHQ